jgi:hypothetical protein
MHPMKTLNLLYNLLISSEFTCVNKGGVKTPFLPSLGSDFCDFCDFLCARVCMVGRISCLWSQE